MTHFSIVKSEFAIIRYESNENWKQLIYKTNPALRLHICNARRPIGHYLLMVIQAVQNNVRIVPSTFKSWELVFQNGRRGDIY